MVSSSKATVDFPREETKHRPKESYLIGKQYGMEKQLFMALSLSRACLVTVEDLGAGCSCDNSQAPSRPVIALTL